MEITTKEVFFDLQSRLGYVPFTQTEEWLDANQTGNTVYFVDSAANPRIACFGHESLKRSLGRKLVINGDTFQPGTGAPSIRDFYREILASGYDAVELSSISEYNPEYEIGIRQAGFVRPLLAQLCPMSIVVDLQNQTPNRCWKRNVKKSAENLTFKVVEKPEAADLEKFCAIFEQLRETKHLGFSLDSRDLAKLFARGRYHLFFVCDAQGQEIAGRIVYTCGKESYDIYAANSDAARTCNASYFLMQSVFDRLAAQGITRFDFGRIPPSNRPINSVYEFKAYSGGCPIAYNGQWSFYKSRIKEWAVFTLNYLIRKADRY